MQLYTNTTNEANAAFRLIYAVKYGSYRGCQRVSTEKSVFFDDFLRTRGLLYLMYRARTVAENGEKDAFSVISDNEWNP